MKSPLYCAVTVISLNLLLLNGITQSVACQPTQVNSSHPQSGRLVLD